MVCLIAQITLQQKTFISGKTADWKFISSLFVHDYWYYMHMHVSMLAHTVGTHRNGGRETLPPGQPKVNDLHLVPIAIHTENVFRLQVIQHRGLDKELSLFYHTYTHMQPSIGLTFRSRCRTYIWCMYWIPSQICFTKIMASSSVSGKLSSKILSNSSPPSTLHKTHTQCSRNPTCIPNSSLYPTEHKHTWSPLS